MLIYRGRIRKKNTWKTHPNQSNGAFPQPITEDTHANASFLAAFDLPVFFFCRINKFKENNVHSKSGAPEHTLSYEKNTLPLSILGSLKGILIFGLLNIITIIIAE